MSSKQTYPTFKKKGKITTLDKKKKTHRTRKAHVIRLVYDTFLRKQKYLH